jgi:hypothetical protein
MYIVTQCCPIRWSGCLHWTYNTVRVIEGSTVCGHHYIFYLIHRCAGHSMTDVNRLLENPVEATTIVQNCVYRKCPSGAL